MTNMGGVTGVARYRCAVQTQVPVTLENVTSGQRPMFFFGSPSAMAWSALAVMGMRMYGNARAKSLEGHYMNCYMAGQRAEPCG